MNKKDFVLDNNDSDRRLDRVVRLFLPKMPLSVIYKALRSGKIRVNGQKKHPDYKTKENDVLSIEELLFSSFLQEHKTRNNPIRQIESLYIYKGKDLLVLNKPVDIAVHGRGSLAESIASSYKKDSLSFKPGPLHRLDKGTEGIICFSQSLKGAQLFSACLKEGTCAKFYLGIIEGALKKETVHIEQNTSEEITAIIPIAQNTEQTLSLAVFHLITGKKHQIRRHCHAIGYQLFGDLRYGGSKSIQNIIAHRYYLLAWRLYMPKNSALIDSDLPDFFEAKPSPEFTKMLHLFPPDSIEKAIQTIEKIRKGAVY
ncbi:RluA family pseudouridine synthase [Treponema phagedenis]|uniref:RluA family pseudouridine synthase n=1 Tax=Treponema phagedenis TaxID=162 RepID=UPI0001F63D87|nr:RluA family pseudouridine synthase [Treponema phagedenis]EFW38453.1 pseudouridine synthase, RluA family [Treponema phagedenis F0421]TYT79031.1 RluA family pseudouridine synthase [Treponema phagedenis]